MMCQLCTQYIYLSHLEFEEEQNNNTQSSSLSEMPDQSVHLPINKNAYPGAFQGNTLYGDDKMDLDDDVQCGASLLSVLAMTNVEPGLAYNDSFLAESSFRN